MPIKQKSKKFEFEYESPDGDLFIITFIENEDRKYVEIKSDTHDTSQTYDFQMLRDIVHEMEVASDTRSISANNLPQPQITDRHEENGIPSRRRLDLDRAIARSTAHRFPVKLRVVFIV